MILDDHNSPFIRVLVKRPGEALHAQVVENTLKTLQDLVGGPVESVTPFSDLATLCHEEGRLLSLPHNVKLFGVDFFGPVIFIGVVGDRFMSVPRSSERLLKAWYPELFNEQ